MRLPRVSVRVVTAVDVVGPGADLVHPSGEAELRYEYDRGGVTVRSGIRFEQVRADGFRAEGQCTGWHVVGSAPYLSFQSAPITEL